MISFADILALGFLTVFIYMAYWIHHAVDMYEHKNYSDYKAYQRTIKESNQNQFKPDRPRDDVGIHAIKSDTTKVTTDTGNGVRRTSDAWVPIDQADPEDIMKFVDQEVGNGSK